MEAAKSVEAPEPGRHHLGGSVVNGITAVGNTAIGIMVIGITVIGIVVAACVLIVGVTGRATAARSADGDHDFRGDRTVVFAIADLQPGERGDGREASGGPHGGAQLRGGAQLGATLRWPNNSRVGFVVNPAGAPPGAVEAMNQAAATWTVEGASGIEIIGDGTTELQGAQTDLVNVVSWVKTVNPSHTFVARTITYWYADEPDVIIAFDMLFNLDHSFAVAGDGGEQVDAWDIETVALHEFGHALGLSHTPPERVLRVMRPTLEPGIVQRSPAVRDLAALADLYGVEQQRPTVGFFERTMPPNPADQGDGIFLGPRELVPIAPDGPGLFG